MPISDPEKRREYKRAWVKRNATHCLAYRLRTEHDQHLRREYGMTTDDYDAMLEKQSHCCAICGRHKSAFKKRLAVDHCHRTGKVRALLCYKCNSLIGLADDSKENLEAAIQYLEKYEDTIRTNPKSQGRTKTTDSTNHNA